MQGPQRLLQGQDGANARCFRARACVSFSLRLGDILNRKAVDFHALVLGTSSWPLAPPSTKLSIPTELLPTYERFGRFYQNKHSGRKLTWLWQLSRMELTTGYTKTKYTFMVSNYQGAILLQFNAGSDSLSFEDIRKATEIDESTLKSNLALMVKQKVLNQDGDTYDLNLGRCLPGSAPEIGADPVSHGQISSRRRSASSSMRRSSPSRRPSRPT